MSSNYNVIGMSIHSAGSQTSQLIRSILLKLDPVTLKLSPVSKYKDPISL